MMFCFWILCLGCKDIRMYFVFNETYWKQLVFEYTTPMEF